MDCAEPAGLTGRFYRANLIGSPPIHPPRYARRISRNLLKTELFRAEENFWIRKIMEGASTIKGKPPQVTQHTEAILTLLTNEN